MRASSATTSPSDQRPTTVVPAATTPRTSCGHRRYDQYGVRCVRASTGPSART
ncbi:hypothetical protein ACFQ1L_05935 [Phytohabitans flavus]|uniref:hypothetical protein n=1 Tax=Phytohabitans flavus TaxID=1076124 RepID=UPI00364410A3